VLGDVERPVGPEDLRLERREARAELDPRRRVHEHRRIGDPAAVAGAKARGPQDSSAGAGRSTTVTPRSRASSTSLRASTTCAASGLASWSVCTSSPNAFATRPGRRTFDPLPSHRA